MDHKGKKRFFVIVVFIHSFMQSFIHIKLIN